MALLLENSVFLHIPKTGGMTVRKLIKENGWTTRELGHIHSDLTSGKGGLGALLTRKEYRRLPCFAFVRHPRTWYRSRWAFRVIQGWKPSHPLDAACASNDFRKFIKNVIQFKPGWLTSEYKAYVKHKKIKVIVGKQESLYADLIETLKACGEPTLKLSDHRENESSFPGYRLDEIAVWDEDDYKKICDLEAWVFEEYGYAM
jgi:hypothetical protein